MSKIVAGVWATVLLAQSRQSDRPTPLSSPLVRLAIALFLLADLSIIFSIWPGASLQFILGPGIALPVSVILIFLTAKSWRIVRGTLLSLLVSGVIFALLVILGPHTGRATAGGQDPNDLSYLLDSVIPIAFALSIVNRGFRRAIALALCMGLAFTVLLTQSRGGVLGLAYILLSMAIVPLRPRASDGENLGRGQMRQPVRVAVRLMSVLILATVAWFLLPTDAQERIGSIAHLSSDYNLDTENRKGRMMAWRRNLTGVMHRPIGTGAGASQMADQQVGGAFMAIHNSILQISVELGILGAVLFLRTYWIAWRSLSRIRAGSDKGWVSSEQVVFARALRVSLGANLVAGFFLSQAYAGVLWAMIAAIAAFAAIASRRGGIGRESDAERQMRRL